MTANGNIEEVKKKGGLLVVSGPSGSGKTTICRQLAAHDEVRLAVSATTRLKRPGEVEGQDYFFLTKEEFEALLGSGEFVEYNEVFSNGVLYGSLKSEVERGLEDEDRYYLMEIDVKGALNLKELSYKGIYIFIAPPSMEELERRLVDRGTDQPESVKQRLKKAQWELEQMNRYDLVVKNDDLDEAVLKVKRFLRLA